MQQPHQAPGSTTLFFGPWYRKSPYFEATIRHGCTAFDIYNHTYLPAYYADPVEEYWHLLNHVTLWDVGVERQVEVSGPDAVAFTELLTPRDLSTCGVGQCKYVLITDSDGGIVNDPVLLRVDADRFWLSAADSDILLWAKGLAHGAGMDVQVVEPDVWPVQVQGPDSRPLLADLLGPEVASLKYYFSCKVDLDGIPLVVSRTGWTGEIGYELYLRDASRGEELYERIFDAGRAYEIRPIAPCEARRIEAGIFNYGSDMRLENNPYEVTGLERLVDLEKPAAFIGREALRRIRADGVRRKLVGIMLDGDRMPAELTEPWPVVRAGQPIGRVTDAIWSPRLERNIGYAWVPIEDALPGSRIEIDRAGDPVAATVAPIPFLDPTKRVPAA